MGYVGALKFVADWLQEFSWKVLYRDKKACSFHDIGLLYLVIWSGNRRLIFQNDDEIQRAEITFVSFNYGEFKKECWFFFYITRFRPSTSLWWLNSTVTYFSLQSDALINSRCSLIWQFHLKSVSAVASFAGCSSSLINVSSNKERRKWPFVLWQRDNYLQIAKLVSSR